MNAIIISALSGVVMMFAGVLIKDKQAVRTLAHVLLLAGAGRNGLWNCAALRFFA
jgi:hypothetical protein